MKDTEVRNNSFIKESRPSPHWDISQERAFIENLMGQRLNFLIVFFTVVVGAAINSQEKPFTQLLVLSCGAPIITLLAIAIARAQEKLNIILSVIVETDPDHPISLATRIARPGGSARNIIGYYIPFICCAISSVAFAYSFLRVCIILYSNQSVYS